MGVPVVPLASSTQPRYVIAVQGLSWEPPSLLMQVIPTDMNDLVVHELGRVVHPV